MSREEKAESLRSEARAFQRAAKIKATPVVPKHLQHGLLPGCGVGLPERYVGPNPGSSEM